MYAPKNLLNKISLLFAVFICLVILVFGPDSASAQAIAPEKSAHAGAVNDAQFITRNIEYNEDAMFLAQKAAERAAEPRIREFAQQMLSDHTDMLYAMEELNAAGTGSSNQNAGKSQAGQSPVSSIVSALSLVSGGDFDTLWVSKILTLQQAKYDELTQVKEATANLRLKMALTEAIPVIRKHVSQLKSLQKYLIKADIQKKKQAAAAEKKK